MFNSFDTLFIVRTVQLLEIAINLWPPRHFLSLERENNPRELNLANMVREEAIWTLTPNNLMPWPCQQMEVFLPSLEPILSFQLIVFTVLFVFLVPLWANAAPILRTAFSCPNFQSICGAQQFWKCLPYLLVRELLVDSHPIPLRGFSSPFLSWSPHLVDHCDVRHGSSYHLV